ncbi:MAG: chloride channel protein [Bacteroidales bacterium]|nr:chloride channel protein [Bacteroidales bacterium]
MQERQKLLLLSLVTGVCSGLAAVLLVYVTGRVKDAVQLLDSGKGFGFLLYLLPGVGMLLSALFVKYVIRDNIGHGVTKVLYAVSRNDSRIKPHNMWSSVVASSVTIGLGGSVGAEAPIVYTGAAIGSNLGRAAGLSYKNVTLLLGCGAAGAIAGIFKAPMAGVLFTIEILLFNASLGNMLPMLLSTLSAGVISYVAFGTTPVFACNLTPFSMANIPFYVLLGAVCALGSLYFLRSTLWLEDKLGRMRSPLLRWAMCASGLGVLIFLFPMLYGEGYSSLTDLLTGGSLQVYNESAFSWMLNSGWGIPLFFLVVFLVKVVAMTFTNAGGGVGGTFGPTLFAGAVLGFVVARCINMVGGSVPEQNFVLVGMAGLMAGVMQAPMTAIFLIAEISGGYQLMLPLIITATISFMVMRIFEDYSIYSKRIAQSGDLLTHDNDQAVLTLLKVSDVMKDKYPRVHPDDSLRTISGIFKQSSAALFAVVDSDGKLEGVVDIDKIHPFFSQTAKYDSIHVYNLMDTDVTVIESDEKMESVMRKFESTGAWRLPVVDAQGHYLGCVSNTRILMAYRDQIRAIAPQD